MRKDVLVSTYQTRSAAWRVSKIQFSNLLLPKFGLIDSTNVRGFECEKFSRLAGLKSTHLRCKFCVKLPRNVVPINEFQISLMLKVFAFFDSALLKSTKPNFVTNHASKFQPLSAE